MYSFPIYTRMSIISSPLTTIVLIALVAILSVWLFILESRIKKLLSGKNAQSLEDLIASIGQDIRDLEKFQEDTENYIRTADARIKRSIQGVETIRFNAFKGTGEGGNRSFAVALLSENGDGAVISSIYSRDRQSVFTKPIKNFESETEMTEEEKEVVLRARRN